MVAATLWGQLKVMLWKVFVIKKRHPGSLFWEFFSPVMYVLILVAVKLSSKGDALSQFGDFPAYNLANHSFLAGQSNKIRVLVTPDDSHVRSVMASAVTSFASLTNGTMTPEFFTNKTDAEKEFLKNSSHVLAGVVFNHNGKGNLSYALRFPVDTLPSTKYEDLYTGQAGCRTLKDGNQENENGLQNNGQCKVNSYLFSGFVQLQLAIDAALIETEYSVTFTLNDILVQMLPKPAFLQDSSYIQILSSMYFVLAYLPLVAFFTGALVTEKQKKIKEGMMMMGLRNSVFWVSWFAVFILQIIVCTVVVTIIVAATKFFTNTNIFLFFISIVFYGFSMIGIACLLSPFFDKAMKAGFVASIGTMLVSCLYLAVSLTRKYEEGTGSVSYTIPVYGRYLLCLFSPVALALGLDQALYLDFRDGLDFTTARQGEFPFIAPLLMLVLDTILYLALAVYFDNVIPGEYGPKQKPYYLFMKSYWFPASRKNMVSASMSFDNQCVQINGDAPEDDEDNQIEAVPAHMKNKASVRINKLTKVFKNREKGKEDVKAVNELTLTIYEDQITAILGHNGAGKTTLMNILTGMTGATSGSASIKGLDVSDPQDLQVLRSMTGVCPQYNLLFDELSCYEHLYLFCGIKGVSNDFEKEIDQALDSVDLKDQKYTKSTDLSGGQKRKLCVAIAIIGDPKIIFLDEPTAGMDPYSRRCLWKTLKEIKKGRIILLTTHFMDEADILADRKAIVNKGSLRCCGSSFYLKNKFGIGYHLNMVVEPDCDYEKIAGVVSSVVPGSEVNRIHGKELDITMPQSGVEKFSDMFGQLEQKDTAQSLGIKNFGVSMTTLEEVFLKLEEEIESIELNEVDEKKRLKDTSALLPKTHTYGSAEIDLSQRDNPSNTVICTEGRTLGWQRFTALFTVHLKNHLRNKAAHIFQVAMPVILVIVGLILSKNLQPDYAGSGGVEQESALLMSAASYTKMNASLGISQYFPYNTVPRLLLRDTVDDTTSRSMGSGLSSYYVVDTYADSFYNDLYTLLAKGVAPHYLGLQLNTLSATGTTLSSSYKVLYNDSAVSSIPVSVNLMNNALLNTARALVSSTDNSSIEVSSFPWPRESGADKVYNAGAFTSTLLVGMAFSFIPASFGIDVVKDREWKIRSQLRVTGLPFFLYWSALFMVHLIKFFVPVLVTIIVVLIAQVESLLYGGAVFSFILVCLFYIPANIFFSYFMSFAYTKWETCMSVQPTIYIMLGYMPYIPVSILDMVLQESTVPNILHTVLCILDPPYLIFGGIYYIDKIHQTAVFTNTKDDIKFGDYFEFGSNIPIVIIMAVVHSILFFFILRVLDIYKTEGDIREACFPGNQASKIPTTNPDQIAEEDEDVSAERSRVQDLDGKIGNEAPVAMVENLRKEFKKASKDQQWKGCKKVPKSETVKAAVRNQTFAVEAGEVFGLLGPNGAGKTTTLNMMIADIGPDNGRVVVGGYNIRSNMSDAFQMVGYCPQHDALWEDITLKEHLTCYAKIRGIPADQVDEITDYFIDNLKLREHENKKATKLSGGTKRKLSYCMAVLGRPKIVLLDEPSTGMDPQSKRFLWDTISESFENSERGAILTTHYMEEADALCSRIAIMVNGTMMCLGSSQHLKNKYGSGYMLEIKISSNEDAAIIETNMERLHGYIKQLFPQATVMEQFGERVQYKVPRSNVISLSRTFTVLEEGKVDYNIAEYSFSQSTLEQVFLEFAKHQMDEEQTEDEVQTERTRSVRRQTSMESAPSPGASPTRVHPTSVKL